MSDPDQLLELENSVSRYLGQAQDFKDQLVEATQHQVRFRLNLDSIKSFDSKLRDFMMRNPIQGLKLFEKKMNQMMKDAASENSVGEKGRVKSGFPSVQKPPEARIGIEGNLGKNFVSPWGLKAHLLNKLVKIRGIVTWATNVKPKLQKSFHYVDETKQGYV